MVNVIVDSSPAFVITDGEAETLIVCAPADETTTNAAIQKKRIVEECDRASMG